MSILCFAPATGWARRTLTYHGEIHLRVARRTALEVDATAVRSGVGAFRRLDGKHGRCALRLEEGAPVQRLHVGPVVAGGACVKATCEFLSSVLIIIHVWCRMRVGFYAKYVRVNRRDESVLVPDNKTDLVVFPSDGRCHIARHPGGVALNHLYAGHDHCPGKWKASKLS